jgi:hypothetical protein
MVARLQLLFSMILTKSLPSPLSDCVDVTDNQRKPTAKLMHIVSYKEALIVWMKIDPAEFWRAGQSNCDYAPHFD